MFHVSFKAMSLVHVTTTAGIVVGGLIPGMQYIPTEVPLACWVVGGGCWRWFTVATVWFYYYGWSVLESDTAKALAKKGYSARHIHYKQVVVPFSWMVTKSRKPIRIIVCWHYSMCLRAVVVVLFVCLFEFCPDMWDSFFFAPVLKGCGYSARVILMLAGYMLKVVVSLMSMVLHALQLSGSAMCASAWYLAGCCAATVSRPTLYLLACAYVCWCMARCQYLSSSFAS